MHELQDVITVHQAPNLKPHSPNMFPTSGVARLNWSLEEWPRSALCEKEEGIPDGNMKMDEVRGTGYLASPVLNFPFFSFLTFHFLPLILLPVFFSFEVLLFEFLCVFLFLHFFKFKNH